MALLSKLIIVKLVQENYYVLSVKDKDINKVRFA